jgi:hypothetical protein
MISPALRFYEAIPDRQNQTDTELVSFFMYFITVEQGKVSASVKEIGECFERCDLKLPSRLPQILSEGTKGRSPRYIKSPVGYRLHRTLSDQLSSQLGSRRVVQQTSAELRSLETSFPDGPKKKFLAEAVDCFEAGANRAAIVMTWILALDHLYDHILANKLNEFNNALAANPPNKKMTRVIVKDDFSELKEGKFIELCRAASIISNDVRKILDDALGTRNTAAHPSGVEVTRNKAIWVIEDLVLNVLKKF